MALDDRSRTRPHKLLGSTWRGDLGTIVLSPVPGTPLPSPDDVSQAVTAYAIEGNKTLITGALHHHELEPFEANGFEVQERLHLLRHDLRHLPTSDSFRFRRGWRRDRPGALEVDRLAFDDFWALDLTGLDDAIKATPTARFRVLGRRPEGISAYAVTGRAATGGYIQRVAVHPAMQRRGIGAALISDALRWLARTGAHQTFVNTQEANTTALALYLSLGFELEPSGLTVMRLDLTAADRRSTDRARGRDDHGQGSAEAS